LLLVHHHRENERFVIAEPEPFTSFRINSAEVKPFLSQAEGNLVLCIVKRLSAKNEILRRFPFALLRALAHSSE
jgi:hypothetical protein